MRLDEGLKHANQRIKAIVISRFVVLSSHLERHGNFSGNVLFRWAQNDRKTNLFADVISLNFAVNHRTLAGFSMGIISSNAVAEA